MHKTSEARRKYIQKYVQEHREQLREYNREWRKKRRQWAVSLLGGACVQCGSPEDLHFDHVDPNTKSMAIGQMLTATEDALRVELSKCQLLCASCHRRKTRENAEHAYAPAGHGTPSMYNIYKCRCEECRTWKRQVDRATREKRKARQSFSL
jgi:5-methylcytosine-specific restriction endonuclease McrA